jgi:phosphopantothenoylcysteine decarboxylase/phosphopantothenate--cysteine ligase
VITGLFNSSSAEDTLSSSIEHISVAQENQILVVAPATCRPSSQIRARLGLTISSQPPISRSPDQVVLAPAMNTNMWNHPATTGEICGCCARADT